MAVRAFGGKFSPDCLTPEQRAAVIVAGIDPEDIVDTSCTSPLLNTCGRDAIELLSQYPIYNPARGVYSRWGDVSFPWNTESGSVDDRWGVALYSEGSSYSAGDSVIVVENDGYKITLYTATTNIVVPAGSLDKDLWQEVCSITTSEPLGLPSIPQLEQEYDYFDPEKTNYGAGQIVLKESGCGDYTCAFVISEINPVLLTKLYCVYNGKPSKCEKVLSCNGKELVSLSSPNLDTICVPVESNVEVGPRR